MLVLSRKMDEEIVIGEGIRVMVLQVKGDRVKLGIQAGGDVKIMRGELLDALEQPQDEEEAEAPHAIADPSAGLAAEPPITDNACPRGARESSLGSARPDPRPAWLTICCCS